MQCPSCEFIFFRSAKKCPSCGAGLSRAAFAPQPDEAFTIYAGGGGESGLLGEDLYSPAEEGGSDLFQDSESYASETGDLAAAGSNVGPDEFELDLSGIEGQPAAAAVEAPAADLQGEGESDSLNFDLGTGEFSDVDVEGMGIDLEIPEDEAAPETAAEPELNLGGESTEAAPEIALDLDEPPEVELDLGEDSSGEAPAGVELNLDEAPEVELDLGEDSSGEAPGGLDLNLDDAPEVELDLDTETAEDAAPEISLDLDDAPEVEVEADTPAAEPGGGSDEELELDGLELDLDLDLDTDEKK